METNQLSDSRKKIKVAIKGFTLLPLKRLFSLTSTSLDSLFLQSVFHSQIHQHGKRISEGTLSLNLGPKFESETQIGSESKNSCHVLKFLF